MTRPRSKAGNSFPKNINSATATIKQTRKNETMKTSFRYPIVCAALFAAATLSSCSSEKESENTSTQGTAAEGAAAGSTSAQTQGGPMRHVDTQHVVVNATVTDINQDTREVTLRGPDGNEFTVVAGDDVRRLDEVRVGDMVRVDYTTTIVAELREATPEEAAAPFTVTDLTSRSGNRMPAASGNVRQYRVVTTVQAIDPANQTITVKGPHGHMLTARAANPANLARVSVGDTVVLTYTEGVALTLVRMNSNQSSP